MGAAFLGFLCTDAAWPWQKDKGCRIAVSRTEDCKQQGQSESGGGGGGAGGVAGGGLARGGGGGLALLALSTVEADRHRLAGQRLQN